MTDGRRRLVGCRYLAQRRSGGGDPEGARHECTRSSVSAPRCAGLLTRAASRVERRWRVWAAECAERARKLRQHQCREGWHLDDEPDQFDVDERSADDTSGTADERSLENEDEEGGDRRVRSTRRRDDAAALPRVPAEERTVGRTFTGRAGQVYRPSMFATLTLPSRVGCLRSCSSQTVA